MITIPTGTDTYIRIPPREEKRSIVERIGVSAEEAAEMIGVSTRTIWKMIKDGSVKTTRVGKRVIVSVQSLREFVDGTR